MCKTLSYFERVSLYSQFTFLAEFYKESNSELSEDYAKNAEIIQSGFTREYTNLKNISICEEIPHEICEETSNIFLMFIKINNVLQSLTEEQKQELNLEELQFQGFDEHNNSAYYSYANYLIENNTNYSSFKNKQLASSVINTVSKYRSLMNTLGEGNYDFELLKRIS